MRSLEELEKLPLKRGDLLLAGEYLIKNNKCHVGIVLEVLPRSNALGPRARVHLNNGNITELQVSTIHDMFDVIPLE